MKFHFTPPKGWINDPNGTIKIHDTYHLFYQHYPDDIVWGPMHWGHATSKDLVNWEHLPIALKPDELGYIFSGSCILDKNNVSGLGKANNPALIAFYTSHNPDTNEEQQSLAYSLDYVHFIPYDKNPVIKNKIGMPTYKKDFRDPKVFENPVKGGYTMALAATRNIDFYHSENLLDWEKTGTFDAQANGLGGICECPDCFMLDGHWVLFISKVVDKDKLNAPLEEKGYKIHHTMEYFIGDFDGNQFIDTQKNPTPLILDHGPDNYAMVSFGDTFPPTFIGWGECWEYARETPATTYRGKMSLARTFRIIKTSQGLRLHTFPQGVVPHTKYNLMPGQSLHLEKLQITVFDDAITITRPNSDFCEFLQDPKHNTFTAMRYKNGECRLIVFEDEGYYEIFADQGQQVFSIQTY